MKPKTIFQKQVYQASKYLPPATDKQLKWAFDNCLIHVGRRLKSGLITCTDCNHTWKDKTTHNDSICPNCAAKLLICDTLKSKFTDNQYFGIITSCKGFQVLRFFHVCINAKVGKRPVFSHFEIVQRWLAPNGKHTTFARIRSAWYSYSDWAWIFSSSLEIRGEKHYHNIDPIRVYPYIKLIPELKRCGFDGNFFNLTPFDLIHALLCENKAETLFKAKQISFLKHFIYSDLQKMSKFWASIKICIRNNYKVFDVSLWCDYIELLSFFGKDTHNAKYVCPDDLKTEHDKYVQKKRDWQLRQEQEENRRKALEDDDLFYELKSRFFGINFSDGLIQVRVLESAEEVMQEGDALHHCIFANEYHLKPDTLLLSACIGNKRLETVEVSLSKLKVIQCRGACNQNTEYHKRIVALVNKNVPLIQKRLSA